MVRKKLILLTVFVSRRRRKPGNRKKFPLRREKPGILYPAGTYQAGHQHRPSPVRQDVVIPGWFGPASWRN